MNTLDEMIKWIGDLVLNGEKGAARETLRIYESHLTEGQKLALEVGIQNYLRMDVQRHEFKFGNATVIGDGVNINGRWFVEQEWLEKFVEMHSERSRQCAELEAENKALREVLGKGG